MTTRPFIIRYRDADNNLTKTHITASDSVEAIQKFKQDHKFNLIYACIPDDFEPCP
jgi:hypothetical protein